MLLKVADGVEHHFAQYHEAGLLATDPHEYRKGDSRCGRVPVSRTGGTRSEVDISNQKASAHGWGLFYPDGFANAIWEAETRREPTYARQRRPQIELAFMEAWAWLRAQGLIVQAPDQGPNSGWHVLSRRAK
jgi:hypothetical protein